MFGLGAILCELLTGEPPYTGFASSIVFELAGRGDTADALARLRRCEADGELVRLCEDCLAPAVEARPRDAGVVAERVTAYRAGVQARLRTAELERAAAEARTTEARAKFAAERRARRLTIGLAAAVLSAVLAGTGGLLWLRHEHAALQAESARRERDLTRGIEADLEKADRLRERARWPEAMAVIERADERLVEAGRDDLRPRVLTVKADLTMIARLDDLRSRRGQFRDGRITGPRGAALPASFRLPRSGPGRRGRGYGHRENPRLGDPRAADRRAG